MNVSWKLGTGLVALVAGCRITDPSERRIADAAVDYNLAVEEAQNATLFLNIVRCMEHHPQHFTDITKVTGSETREGKLGLTVPFGRGTSDAYVLSPEITETISPTYEVGVLHTKEFTRGITQPISVGQIQSFIDQGWPFEFLLMLFVREVVITTRDSEGQQTKQERIFNSFSAPDDKGKGTGDGIARFHAVLDALFHDSENALVIRTQPDFLTPPLNAEQVAAALKTEAFIKGDIVIDGDTCRARSSEDKYSFAFSRYEQDKKKHEAELQDGQELAHALMRSVAGGSEEYELRLRSPEAVIYYLGEIMRIEVKYKSDWRPTWHFWEKGGCEAEKLMVLFYASERENANVNAFLRIGYGGVEYVIPSSGQRDISTPKKDMAETENDLSMMTLAFITLLVDMNKSREELPTAGLVQVLGRR